MAYQVRLRHPLVLAILGMCLITYSSYYASTGIFHSRAPDPARMLMLSQAESSSETTSSVAKTASPVTNVTTSTIAHAVSSLIPEKPPKTNTSIGTNHVAFEVIQKIPPKQPTENHVNRTLDNTEDGVLTRHVHETGYDVSNAHLCPDSGKNMQLIIAVTSAPSHREARMAIRQTWGHYRQRSDMNIAFLIGSTTDKHVLEGLQQENELYGDLIRARFLDTYNNLTLKTLSMLEWVDHYCKHVNFVLKTDDDMFINIPKLLSFIEKHAKDKRIIFGRLAKKWKPIRNKKSKYYASPNQYQPSVFPDFTTGPAYLITGDVVHDLYTAALDKTYLKLEDVFITGIVAEDIKIKRTHVNEFLNKRVSFSACNIQKGISIHMVKPPEQFDLWKKLLDGKSKCK